MGNAPSHIVAEQPTWWSFKLVDALGQVVGGGVVLAPTFTAARGQAAVMAGGSQVRVLCELPRR